jgi:ubiquinone/menaquinone biosynthesis C-methylase UbiE
MLFELYRVLKPGGVLVAVSYGSPDTRINYFEKPKLNWRIEQTAVEKPRVQGLSSEGGNDSHYIYICTKEQQ